MSENMGYTRRTASNYYKSGYRNKCGADSYNGLKLMDELSGNPIYRRMYGNTFIYMQIKLRYKNGRY